MRAVSKQNSTKTNAVQPTPPQGSQRSYIFSTPSWGPLSSRDRWDKGKVKEIEGHWQQRGQEKFIINDQGKGVVAQVYFSLSVFAAVSADILIQIV